MKSSLPSLEELIAKRQVIEKLLVQARFGSVFFVNDNVIHFPNDPSRVPHPSRRVIVVQSESYCLASRPNTVLVVPCSGSSTEKVGDYDFVIPNGESAFTADRAVAFVSLIMPILKNELVGYAGALSEAAAKELFVRIARILGIADAV